MAYADHFKLADDLIAHFDVTVPTITDPFIVSRYAGLTAVIGVTSYELAVRDIYCDFAAAKHLVLENFARAFFGRLNGRIGYKNLCDDYSVRFGEKYRTRLKRKINELEQNTLKSQKKSPQSSYGNLITWRHLFVHEGALPNNATYKETVDSYELGKLVIHCLATCMRR